jgi:hypothetical protein
MNTDGFDLRNLIQARHTVGLQPFVNAVNKSYLPAAIQRYNSEYSIRYFGRPVAEPIPSQQSALSSFRSRLGGLIEYGLGVTLDQFLQEEYRDELRLSFAVASEYPDFYIRDRTGARLLRVDCKVLHDESDEYSARFTHPVSEIQANEDILLYAAWKWTEHTSAGVTLVYPEVLDGLIVPAIDIGEERDRRTELAGGYVGKDDVPYVPRRAGTGYSLDTNYGKIDRIVHGSRRDAESLSPNIAAFLEFTDRHADAVFLAGSKPVEISPTPDERDPE